MKNEKTGDIMIFEAGGDFISKCIAKLTGSTVSHAAMVYGKDLMVEMGAKGIVVDGYAPDASGETVHFLRLVPEQNPEPLVKAAKAYLEAGAKFDYPDMLLLAGLLIYREVRPTMRWKKITDLILELVCCALDKFLNKLLQKGGNAPAMTCSQLVYQCYRDCGKNYELVLQNSLLQTGAGDSEAVRLADLIQEEDIAVAPPLQVQVAMDGELLCRELYHALEETETAGKDQLLTRGELGGVASSAAKLLDLLEQILKTSEIPLPALFVTPCDLLEHTKNLTEYDAVRMRRVRL